MKTDAMINQIFQLHQAGHSIRKISAALKLSRNTVRHHLRQAPAPQETQDPPGDIPNWEARVDWQTLVNERRKGVTAKQLYKEHAPAISYSRFCRGLRKRLAIPAKPALALSHEAGQKAQVDFADGPKLMDRKTGALTKTHLFCGVLPFSSYTYGEFVMSQRSVDFIRAHERMWAYFGGVTPYVVLDNLRAGVSKAHRYDPDVNPTYCDYGTHSGFAALPARPYQPRDKAAVEAAIGAIQRSFFQEVRERAFYSLAELNQAFRLFLNDFNQRLMTDYGVSRAARFGVEKPALLPLPAGPYQLAEWRTAKVHPDSCIQIQKALYSVPFSLVGREVRVKITDKLVEVFDEDTCSVACHARKRPFEVAICEEHLPPRRQQTEAFELKKARAKAAAIGPSTNELVEELFAGDRPLQNLRRVQGLLRLWEGECCGRTCLCPARICGCPEFLLFSFAPLVTEHSSSSEPRLER